jgi:hypothetical protein
MAQILTLLQVRGSPRFAWHPQGYLWVDGELFRAVRLEPPATGGYQGVLTVKPSVLRDGDHTLDGGWRHGEGCGCDLCSSALSAPDSGADPLGHAEPRTWTVTATAARQGRRERGDLEKHPSD